MFTHWPSHWIQLLHQGPAWAACSGFLIILFISFVPVLPIPAVAAALGAVLNLPLAVLVTWSSATLGAVMKYFLIKYLFQRQAYQYAARLHWDAFFDFVRKNGFVAVLIARLIPIFPSFVINLAAAVTNISFGSFLLATALGKFPTMLTFTIVGHSAARHTWVSVSLVAVYALLVMVVGYRFRGLVSRKNR